jgi:hypothetical protein
MVTLRMQRIAALCTCLLAGATAGCQWPSGASTSAPPARLLTEIGPQTPVGDALALLQAQLDTVLAAGLDDAGPAGLDRAESISDRLLETRLPFAWISAESYSVEARLRQVQSMTDRVGAMRAGGARHDEVLVEIDSLRVAVGRLRDDLAKGGRAAPPPVQQLLATMDTSSP